MKIKTEKLLALLENKGITGAELAAVIGVPAVEIEKMLNGEAVDVHTARKLIYYLGADAAQHYIDWDAIGKINPLANDGEGGENNDGDNV